MTERQARFDLFETMALDPQEGIAHLDRHIDRMRASAETLGFCFDRHTLRNELQTATFRIAEPSRVRILLSPTGAVAIEVRPLAGWPQAIVPVSIVPRHASADDIRLLHKTTARSLYDEARAEGGTFEVLLTDEQGYLTEGTFTSIFVERDDMLVTPPLARGILPGILRQHLLDLGEAVEGDLRPYDLTGHNFYIGNSVRGLVAATLVARRPVHG